MMTALENSKLESLKAPAVLRELKQWLVWKFEPNPKPGKKDLKVPHYAKSGTKRGWFPGVRGKKIGQGSPEEMPLLVTFDEAKAAAIQRGMEGVGLAMVAGCPITALDFDHCVADGVIHPDVEALIVGTYAEISPSGTGVRAFVKGNLGDRSDAHPDDGSFGFETYSSSRFVTFTGNMTADTVTFGCENEVAEPSPLLLETCEKRFGPRVIRQVSIGKSDKERVGLTDAQIKVVLQYTAIGDYHRWMAIGFAIHHETEGEGEWLWDEWSQQGDLYEGPDDIRYKWSTMGSYSSSEKTFWSVLREAQAQGCPIDVDTASPDEFEVLEPLPLKAHGEFGFYSMAELREQLGPPEWLIKGILPKTELGMLFGASTAGKSFVLMDMCAAIARGVEWNGRRVKKGRVLYVVAEGRGGFPNRMEAYCKKHGIDESEVPIVYAAGKIPNLADNGSVKAFIAEIKRFGPFDLIIIDTLAKVSVGADENSGKDMGIIMANAEAIGVAAGGTPILVHHSGKDTSRGSRGHGSLKGNVGVELEVSRAENAVLRTLYVHKVKDAPAGFGLDFKLEVVPVDQVDEDGVPETSCTVEYITGVARDAAVVTRQPRGTHERTVLNVVHEMTGLEPTAQVSAAELVERAIAETVRGTAKQDNRRRDVKRALDALLEQGWLIEDGEYVQLGDESNAQ